MRLSPTPTLPREEREKERSGASVDMIRTPETLGYDPGRSPNAIAAAKRIAAMSYIEGSAAF
jgi:hypothetical protein